MQLLDILHQGICRMHDGRENWNYQASPQGNELGPFVSFGQILILCLYRALLTKPCPKNWKDKEKIIVKIYAGFRRFKLFLLLKKITILIGNQCRFQRTVDSTKHGRRWCAIHFESHTYTSHCGYQISTCSHLEDEQASGQYHSRFTLSFN